MAANLKRAPACGPSTEPEEAPDLRPVEGSEADEELAALTKAVGASGAGPDPAAAHPSRGLHLRRHRRRAAARSVHRLPAPPTERVGSEGKDRVVTVLRARVPEIIATCRWSGDASLERRRTR